MNVMITQIRRVVFAATLLLPGGGCSHLTSTLPDALDNISAVNVGTIVVEVPEIRVIIGWANGGLTLSGGWVSAGSALLSVGLVIILILKHRKQAKLRSRIAPDRQSPTR